MIDLLLAIPDILSAFAKGVAGWRYVLSERYRQRTHERWKDMRQPVIAMEVITYVAGVLGTAGGLVAVVVWVCT